MFASYSLQRNKPKTVVLIHGLFATSGFWLPALKHFPHHRIVLVNVDYDAYLNDDGPAQLAGFLRQSDLGLDDSIELVGHSFGSVLTATVDVAAARRYHLCPIFLAENARHDDLAAAVCLRLGKDAPAPQTAMQQMRSAIESARKVELDQVAARGDCCLIPDGDHFFTYREGPAGMSRRVYHGDHFEVADALAPFFPA